MAGNYKVIKDRKVRFALVGCGRISEKHFESFRKHAEQSELIAVCDINSAALKVACSKTGAKGYSSLEFMLQDQQIDAVVIATPSGLHASQGIQVAHAGFHVITEKPMATRWGDGKTLSRRTMKQAYACLLSSRTAVIQRFGC